MSPRLAAAVLLVVPVAVVMIVCGAVCVLLAALAWPFERMQDLGRAFFQSISREIHGPSV